MLKKAALLFGVVFLVIGIGGFLPFLLFGTDPATSSPMLLGLFAVNGVHNLIHIASGLGALAGSTSTAYARLYFKIFGVVYALVTVLGFLSAGSLLLGLVPINLANNLLHVAIAAVTLYLGFVYKGGEETHTTRASV